MVMYPNACIMSERKANNSDKSLQKIQTSTILQKILLFISLIRNKHCYVLNERDDPSEVEHCFTHTVLAV